MHEVFAKYLDEETLTKLHGIRMDSKRRFGGASAGEHRSFRMGQAIEFDQHRQYAPGDDLRYIDWKIYGRADKFYLKQSEDEADLTFYVLLDCSESMSFAGSQSDGTKFDFAIRLALAIAFVSLGQQDPISVGVFADRLREYVPPSNSIGGLAAWDHLFDEIKPSGISDLTTSAEQFVDTARQPGMVVLISDLLGPNGDLEQAAPALRKRGNDVLVLHILDRDERLFPFEGETRFLGLEELGMTEVNSSQIRQSYLKEVDQFVMQQRQICWNLGFGFDTATTDEPIDALLSRSLFS